MKDMRILFEEASKARLKAYAPYSNFLVGSCLETANGKLFSGCNVENAAYSVALCAESNAITAMILAGEHVIKQIMVVVKGPGVAYPCGACRQRLYEFSRPETVVHLCDLAGGHRKCTLDSLMPHGFGFKDLGMESVDR